VVASLDELYQVAATAQNELVEVLRASAPEGITFRLRVLEEGADLHDDGDGQGGSCTVVGRR
jgi:hypothetical protein